MKIVKYKKGAKGLYKVLLDDGRDLSLYEDVILKFDLLLKREILESEMESIRAFNLECDVYYVALNNIKARVKSRRDLCLYLQKCEYPQDLIDKAISKLVKQGYLDDRLYAKSYINNLIVTTNKGPLRIEKDLIDKGVDASIIGEELVVFDDELQDGRIKKLIEKGLKLNRTRGGSILKQKIVNDIKLLGYDSLAISRNIVNYSFSNDKDIAEREYEKLKRRLSRKYSGEELKRKIREKLYQKGLSYEEE